VGRPDAWDSLAMTPPPPLDSDHEPMRINHTEVGAA